MTEAQKRGKRYEGKVYREVADSSDCTVYFQPWFKFHTRTSPRPRYCQPDILMVNGDHLVILECKYTHTRTAYWQLRRLYEHVIKVAFPRKIIRVCEITRNFEAGIQFPEDMWLCPSMDYFLNLGNSKEFGVIQWKL